MLVIKFYTLVVHKSVDSFVWFYHICILTRNYMVKEKFYLCFNCYNFAKRKTTRQFTWSRFKIKSIYFLLLSFSFQQSSEIYRKIKTKVNIEVRGRNVRISWIFVTCSSHYVAKQTKANIEQQPLVVRSTRRGWKKLANLSLKDFTSPPVGDARGKRTPRSQSEEVRLGGIVKPLSYR